MSDEQQRFPAWPLITAVISDSQRPGSYTARVEYPNAPMRILKRGDLQTLRREIITQVQKWTNDEWRKPVRLQVEDPHGRWLLGIPRDGAAVELDAIATTPEPPTVPDRPATPTRRPATVRAAVDPRRSRIRARRLLSLAGVILAAAAVALVVIETLPGHSSAADHHQLAVARTTTAVTPTATANIPAVIVKPTPKPARRRVDRHQRRHRPARAHRAVTTRRVPSTPPQSAAPN
ncbi:MAG: hypothetical protein ACLP50_30900, partial [Solirubrobacteraceae bacterium]